MGLRELKKIKTRKAISDMATLLFIERGFENVTTAEIAEKAEVSVPTLFKYFPNKESLVFDEDSEMEAELVAAVIGRAKGVTILDALLAHGQKGISRIKSYGLENFHVFKKLVDSTPALAAYDRQLWTRHEQSLAVVIRKESPRKLSKPEAEAIAAFVLNAFHRSLGVPQGKVVLESLFDLLKQGWRG